MYYFTDETFAANFLDLCPLFVMFHAPWAGPCNLVRDDFMSLENAHPKVSFGMVDIDECIETPSRFNVRAIPLFVLFDKSGNMIGMTQGAVGKEILEGMLNESK